MSRPAPTTGADRLLHCSPERTLFLTTDAALGTPVVCKLLVRGSLGDAEHEVAMGLRFADHDVAGYLRAGHDGPSNRPCVISRWEDGTDLDHLVGAEGALPAARACAALLPVARTLAAMHAHRAADAPHGICHGDVKPGNLLRTASTTLLLDFEHSCPITIAGRAIGTFTGGSLGFSPPEAKSGAAPTAAFDVFGLGATLRWLLTGGGPCALPQHPAVQDLVRAMTAADPAERPSAATVTAALHDLVLLLQDDPAEHVLHLVAIGETTRAGNGLASLGDLPRRAAIERLVRRRHRLLQRVPRALLVPETLPEEPGAVLRELQRVQQVLRRFPRHAGALRHRHALCTAAGALLGDAAARTNARCRDERFDTARAWLTDALALAGLALRLPGRCPIPCPDEPRSVGPLHRAPQAFLRHLLQEVQDAQRELDAETLAITRAEEQLDLAAAERAIDHLTQRYGGTSPTATRRRDQLHRLGFYLDRTARAQANIERVIQVWDGNALAPLVDLAGACAAATARLVRSDGSTGPVGLRSLQVTLVNLVEEFPHLYPRVGPALEALSSALEHTTDQSWELLAEAQRQLGAVPVPVRPLQTTLARLDTFRILEAVIDRPERPRSQLQDGIESLRLVLEQARATRDRLAQGAEQAMARGHWTTGLFDMERAVGGLNPTDEHERSEAQRLRDRLEQARRRKQELEAALRRNVELETRYGTLQDDAASTFRARLGVLGERRDCLHFLAMHLPADRAALYSRDLREVETQIALEQAALAETELDGTEDPEARLRLARATIERLGGTMAAGDAAAGAPGRLQRLLDHWRTLAANCQREVERRDADRAQRERQRRRLLAIGIAALLVCLTAVGFSLAPWLAANPAHAGSADPHLGITRWVDEAPAHLRQPAAHLLATATRASDDTQPFAAAAWHADLAQSLTAFAAAMQPADGERAAAFATACWQAGLAAAFPRSDAAAAQWLHERTEQLGRSLAAHGIRLAPGFSAQLRDQRR